MTWRRLLLVAMIASACESASVPEPAPPSAAGDARPIVAFGDSYTEGTGVSREEAYPALLARALGAPVVNAGRLGQTALEALPRLEGDVLARKPRLVIVEFGVNEAFRGYPVTSAIDGLERITARLGSESIPIVLVGVHYAAFQENFDAALRRLAEKYDCGLVLDVLKGVLDHPDLKSDVYHPNARGYAMMEERIRPVVAAALEGRRIR